MTRPRRLFYYSPADSYYYIIGGKKKKVKVDNRKITQKQLAKINITNIIGDLQAKRVKRRKKRKTVKLQKSISDDYLKQAQSSFGWQFYIPKKEIPELSKIQSSSTSDKELAKTIQQLEKTQIPKMPTGVSKESQTTTTTTESKGIQTESKVNYYTALTAYNKIADIYQETKKYPKTVEEFKAMVKGKKPIDESIFEQALLSFKEAYLESKTTEPKSFFSPTESSKAKSVYAPKEGKGYVEDDGLYNDELQKLLFDKTNKVVPVIAKDELQQLLKYVEPNQKYFTAVINTNPSTSDGTGKDGYPPGHWTCIFIDNRDDYPSAEWYDPLAGAPDKSILTIMKRICEVMNKEKMFLYKQNMVKNQSDTSANCGYFCLKFIDDRVNGVPYSKATGFDDIVDKSKDGEIKIEKYKSYL